jgi:hypothetical protein
MAMTVESFAASVPVCGFACYEIGRPYVRTKTLMACVELGRTLSHKLNPDAFFSKETKGS